MARVLLDPGVYACDKHPEMRITMLMRFVAANCGHKGCGKRLARVGDLSRADRNEMAADNRRADREEAKLAGRT